jgi:restriction system protein
MNWKRLSITKIKKEYLRYNKNKLLFYKIIKIVNTFIGGDFMSRRKNKDFNHVIIVITLFLIIISIPKMIWTNIFFASLTLAEIALILILSYFWLENYLIKTKDICSKIDDIDKMEGIEFEVYIKELYIKLGYNAKTTPINDFGADVIATKDDVKLCIQAKRYNKNRNVGISAVQEVIGSLNYYKANKGIVITTSNFTKSAYKLSEINNITLIGRSQLQSLILDVSKSTHPALLKFISFIREP